MKTLLLALYLTGMAFAVSLAQAQDKPAIPAFGAIDKDMDGVLSIKEAQLLFPSLAITDVVNDGFMSRNEAELALPGLVFGNDDQKDGTELLGPDEYALMAEQYFLAEQEAAAN